MKTLYELRHDMDVTQGEVADFVGVSTNSISQFEKGSRLPSLKTAQKLATFFHVSVDDIHFGAKKSSKKRRK